MCLQRTATLKNQLPWRWFPDHYSLHLYKYRISSYLYYIYLVSTVSSFSYRLKLTSICNSLPWLAHGPLRFWKFSGEKKLKKHISLTSERSFKLKLKGRNWLIRKSVETPHNIPTAAPYLPHHRGLYCAYIRKHMLYSLFSCLRARMASEYPEWHVDRGILRGMDCFWQGFGDKFKTAWIQ